MSKHVLRHEGRVLGNVQAPDHVRIDVMTADDSEKMRLISMGLRQGVEIEMKINSGKGPVVVAFGNSRLALGRALAKKIWVV